MKTPGTDRTTIYAIYWPSAGVLKVGRTRTMARITALTSTGGHVLLLMRDRPEWEETAALAALAALYPRAFATEQSSLAVIARGRGFTECYRVQVHDLQHAIEAIFRGIARHGNEQAETATAGDIHRRGSHLPPPRSTDDGDRASDARRRPRARVDDVLDGESGGLAGRPVDGRGHADRAHAAARRRRLHRDIHGRRPYVLPGARVAFGVAPRSVEAPETSARTLPEIFWKRSRIVRGLGERGRAGRGCAREARWNPAVAILSGTPACRNQVGLSSLRYRSSRERPMGRRAARRSGSAWRVMDKSLRAAVLAEQDAFVANIRAELVTHSNESLAEVMARLEEERQGLPLPRGAVAERRAS